MPLITQFTVDLKATSQHQNGVTPNGPAPVGGDIKPIGHEVWLCPLTNERERKFWASKGSFRTPPKREFAYFIPVYYDKTKRDY